eukprot:GILK01006690.1.p1 GENE.GILK01006690.1~~GILK01006690.1.p1  ORF type:complete len:452 (+),score=39.66 GILK01006690.1:69-1424(+)
MGQTQPRQHPQVAFPVVESYVRKLRQTRRRSSRYRMEQNCLCTQVAIPCEQKSWSEYFDMELRNFNGRFSWWTKALVRFVREFDSVGELQWDSEAKWLLSSLATVEKEEERISALDSYLRKALVNPSHPIGGLVCRFQQVFSDIYAVIPVDKYPATPNGMHISEKAIIDVQQFIKLAHGCLLYLYSSTLQLHVSSSLRELSFDVLTSQVFSSRVHSLLMKMLRQSYVSQEHKLRQQTKSLSPCTPADLGISALFCLDGRPVDGQTPLAAVSPSSAPYEAAVRCLRCIESMQSPMQKLECIVATSRVICQCVDMYWRDCNIRSKDLCINADDLLSIFAFVVVHSNLVDIFAHCRIIEEFTTDSIRRSMPGYYLATLQAAVELIQNLSGEGLSGFSGCESVSTKQPLDVNPVSEFTDLESYSHTQHAPASGSSRALEIVSTSHLSLNGDPLPL